MNAIRLYDKPSAQFHEHLQEAIHVLQAAEFEYLPLTQASSLGAEDMVITHLLYETGIEASVFVLDTGMLHNETVALIERLETLLQHDDAAAGRLALELRSSLNDPRLQDELLLLCDLVDDVEYQQALDLLTRIRETFSTP